MAHVVKVHTSHVWDLGFSPWHSTAGVVWEALQNCLVQVCPPQLTATRGEANALISMGDIQTSWRECLTQVLGSLLTATPQDTISLSYSHRILQGVLDISLSQEHIPPAHPPKHTLKSRDAFSVNHASHEAVGRRARWGMRFPAVEWEARRHKGRVRGKDDQRETAKFKSESCLSLVGQPWSWLQSEWGKRLRCRGECILEASPGPASLVLWKEGWKWRDTYPSLKGVPLPISLGSKREEDSSNRSGSAICWWCNSAWIHKSINI